MSGLGNKEIMAKNIKFYMEQSGKERNQICDDLGFKYSTFSAWANGDKYPRIDKIEMLANYFGIQKSDLIEDSSQRPINPNTGAPATKREITQLEEILKMDNLTFMGAPLDEDDKEKIKRALELAFWDAKDKNKRK